MKFGLCLPIRSDCTIEFNIELAKRAESLGFDSVWVSDHVVIPNRFKDAFSSVFYDPFVLLSAIASETSKIKLGTSVIILPYRNPVSVAKMTATLDVLSEGRLIVGVAAGWLKEEFDCLNADFKNRGMITNEYIKSIRELWDNDHPEFHGDYVEFSDIYFYPKPFNNRIPDIWIGGGSKSAIKRSIELGNGWQPTWVSPVEYAKYYKEIKESADERNIDLTDFVFSVRNRIRLEEPGKKVDASGDPPYLLRGTIAEIAEEVEKFERSGVEYFVFDPEAGDEGETYDIIGLIAEKIIGKRE